jgi:hypothetical protein
MACIVKKPVQGTRGLLVLTDGELRDFLEISGTLQEAFEALRANWIIAVHCNSAVRQKVRPHALIDAYIAGPGDILPAAGFTPYQIAMDCSNFCPDYFAPRADIPKFWDVLFVSRNQPFKSLDILFHTVREIFNQTPMRILAIIAHENPEGLTPEKSEPVRLYQSMFSVQERKLFTLLTPSIDYPFSFDLPTIANFYHQSKTFLHTAPEERHPRVVGYAWAAGLCVVAPRSVAALLPEALRQPPGFFAFDNAKQAAAAVRQVVEAGVPLQPAYSTFHLAQFQIPRFKDEIRSLYAHLAIDFADDGWFLDNLDLRLARHHVHNAGTNAARASLLQLAHQLRDSFPPEIAGDAEIALDAYALKQRDDNRVAREAAAERRFHPVKRFQEIRAERGVTGAARAALRHLFKAAR